MLAGISIGMGLGTAAAMAGGGEPDLAGSLITGMAVGLCALVGYCLGLLVSQLTRTSRVSAGISSVILTSLYVLSNISDKLGALEPLRYISPFYYAKFSRALVPGYGLDVPASLAMVAMSAVLFMLASWAFQRRDYGAALWQRQRARERRQAMPGRGSQRAFGTVTTASLYRGRWGLLAWALGAGSFSALMMLLEPSVIDMWSVFGKYMPGTGGSVGIPIEMVYVGFSGEIVALVIVAYAIAQAAGWASDLADGRAEAVLASPVSWSRLVLERLLALAIGVAFIVGGTVVGLAAGAASVGLHLDAAGVGRLLADGVLFGTALGGLAAIVVAAFRRGAAITVLAVVVSGSYLQGYLAKIFEWPQWVERSSLFIAFGNPYVEWPGTGEVLLLLALAVLGALLAARIAERTPKVA
jgi:ABC-2 type transport system permease protein